MEIRDTTIAMLGDMLDDAFGDISEGIASGLERGINNRAVAKARDEYVDLFWDNPAFISIYSRIRLFTAKLTKYLVERDHDYFRRERYVWAEFAHFDQFQLPKFKPIWEGIELSKRVFTVENYLSGMKCRQCGGETMIPSHQSSSRADEARHDRYVCAECIRIK